MAKSSVSSLTLGRPGSGSEDLWPAHPGERHRIGWGTQLPVIDRLAPKTLAVVSRWQPTGTLGTGGSNFCREGCAVFDGQILLMPEDGPDTTIYRFTVPAER